MARFIERGKRAKRARERRAREKRRDEVLDGAVGAVQYATHRAPRLCLPSCVLLQRVLDRQLPGHGFELRLGSLHVIPEDTAVSEMLFDPRGPNGIDDGFHAWLEDKNGQLLDPSILLTLSHDGYDVAGDGYVQCERREFVHCGLLFRYEELPDLALVGVEESAVHLDGLVSLALTGIPPTPGTIFLDICWRQPPDDGK